MLSGKVAATLGGFWNYEAIQLRLMHKHPLVIPVDQAGVPSYDELVLVVREDEARTRRPGPARVPAGAHPRRARGARRPGGGGGAGRQGQPRRCEAKLQLESIKQTLPAAQPADAEQALRLAGPVGVGGVRQLDVLAAAAPAQPRTPGCPRSPTSSCPGRGSDGRWPSGRERHSPAASTSVARGAHRTAHRRRRLPRAERGHPRGRAARAGRRRAQLRRLPPRLGGRAARTTRSS